MSRMSRIDIDLHERVAQRVREYALARKIVLTHLPHLAGVSASNFWSALNVRISPSLEFLRRIAAALEIDVAELIAPWPSETEVHDQLIGGDWE
jgi:transcriptional regulator with XRE-family HTH domain